MGSVAGSLAASSGSGSTTRRPSSPGTVPSAIPTHLDAVEGYLVLSNSSPSTAKAAGVAPLEAAREADLGEYAEWLDAERLVGNLHRAYAELDGEPLGAPIDIVAAFVDMITYNGGRPLRCLA